MKKDNKSTLLVRCNEIYDLVRDQNMPEYKQKLLQLQS
jgi:hypothetical protein